jgi:hypothetical protein
MKKTYLFGAITFALLAVTGGYVAWSKLSVDRARLTDAQLAAEPFVGVTTGGKVIPNLFPVAVTGVSTQAMHDATAAFA